MRGRFIVTLTGGIVVFLRFLNRLLGFVLFFTGLWVVAVAEFIAFLVRTNTQWANAGTRHTVSQVVVYVGIGVAIFVFLLNIRRLFIIMPDNRLKRFFASFFNRDYSPEREGNKIPANMLKQSRNDTGFFFGTKLKGGIFGFFTSFFYVGKPAGADGHILVVGGAGSGKSSCISIPTLETWGGTMFAIDIKGDLSAYYANIKKHDKKPYVIFDPTNPKTKGYDPYYLLRNSKPEDLVQNAREIALSIIPLPADTTDPYWIESAQNILTGGILYYEDMGATFSQTMDDILSEPVENLIKHIMASDILPAQKFVSQYKGMKSETIASIATTLCNNIMVFATDPLIYDALSKDEADCFRMEDLEHSNIFIKLPQDKITQWGKVVTLMANQLIRTLERRADQIEARSKDQAPILLAFDEFANVGKIESIEGALATLRSKGVTIALFIQSIAQLDRLYGHGASSAMLDNCPYKAILNVASPKSQEHFSKLTGTFEVEKKGYSVNYDPDSGIEVGSNENFMLRREPIIFPHEFAQLNDIILMTPEGFSRVDKEPYYKREEHRPSPTAPPMKVTDVTAPVTAGFFERMRERQKIKAQIRARVTNMYRRKQIVRKVSENPHGVYRFLHAISLHRFISLNDKEIDSSLQYIHKYLNKSIAPFMDKDIKLKMLSAKKKLHTLQICYRVDKPAKDFKLDSTYASNILRELWKTDTLIANAVKGRRSESKTNEAVDGILECLDNVLKIYDEIVVSYSKK